MLQWLGFVEQEQRDGLRLSLPCTRSRGRCSVSRKTWVSLLYSRRVSSDSTKAGFESTLE